MLFCFEMPIKDNDLYSDTFAPSYVELDGLVVHHRSLDGEFLDSNPTSMTPNGHLKYFSYILIHFTLLITQIG